MDHHGHHHGGGGGGSGKGGSGGGNNSRGRKNANKLQQHHLHQLQQQQASLANLGGLMELARQGGGGGGGGGPGGQAAAAGALAELFAAHQQAAQVQQAQQQHAMNSSGGGGNPLSLLQQQMNAIMQQQQQAQQGQGQPPPPSQSPQGSSSSSNQFNNPAAAWWYLEYLSRIQAAQMIPNLEQQQQENNANNSNNHATPPPKKKRTSQGHSSGPGQQPQPPPMPQPQQAHPQKIESKRGSTGSNNSKRSRQAPPQPTEPPIHPLDALNLSKLSKKLPNRLSNPVLPPGGAPLLLPPTQSTSSTSTQPPMAHSTPINLSTPPGKSSTNKEPPPAHQVAKPVHYTHMIPKLPQIGLIGRKPDSNKKKKTVASLLAQSRSPINTNPLAGLDAKEISYRPWLVEDNKLIIPNVGMGGSGGGGGGKSSKDPPDFTLPLRMGWKRETMVKNTDFKMVYEGNIFYITPQGVKCKSVNEIKKCLNQRTAELTPRHFTFNTSLILGSYIFDVEGEKVTLPDSDLKDGHVLKKLTILKEEQALKREQLRLKLLFEEKEKLDKERKRQHGLVIKSLEILKKSKRRIKQAQERRLKKRLELEEEKETTKLEFVDELSGDLELKALNKLETCLEPGAFSNLLQIYEFLNTFGETLGFDMDSLPDLESLLKGFINQQENEEELQSILIHLIVCAVEDPGMPNPTKHMTTFNQTLKQADVNFGSLSEILRIYLEGISDSEPEAETYANWLAEAPFTCHNPKRKTVIVAYLCDILLQNKAVLKHLENSSELIHNCKKERVQNDVKIRKLRMVLARRAVASACEEEGAIPPEPPLTQEPEDEEDKLSIDELKSKMSHLQNTNEKLKKQMQLNFKNIRTQCLGQDRYRRRFWNLPHSGGIFIEGGVSGEFEELRQLVKEKFEKNGEALENDENVAPIECENNVNVFLEVPPPCIKIFSFAKDSLCSAKRPSALLEAARKKGPTDDELLIKKVKKEVWSSYFYLDEGKEVEEFVGSLVENGLRERELKAALEAATIGRKIPRFEDTELEDEQFYPHDIGVDPDLVYRIHLGLIETLEGLEERVAGASLQVKNFTLPLPRNLHHSSNLKQSEIVSLVKDRLLELEQAVERRYLKPPLGKSANELNLSNLVGEDNASALAGGEQLIGPCGSTSSTRGQQIQENNKLKEQKEKEERLQAANESKNSCSRFLTHWRESVRKTSSPSVLSMAIYLLDSSIAWDKSVMKASCQLCKGGDNEDKLLLCDACDRGYHTYCFKPPLEQIPDGDWFCWECINKATGNRGCIVCGKGTQQGKKLLACDKCVKAFHTDCIVPNVAKVPRGRWYCPDHQPNPSSSSYTSPMPRKTGDSSSTTSSPKKNNKAAASKQAERPITPTPVIAATVAAAAGAVSPAQIPVPTTPEIVEDKPESPQKEVLLPQTPPLPPPPPPPVANPKKTKKQKKELEWCDKILEDLMGHEDAWPFLEPVNTRQFPTYRKVIKTPMDLATIKKNLSTSTYKSRDCFLTDVRLIFDNCETFNEDDSPVGKAGHNLRIFFESLNNFNCTSESNN